MMKNILIGIIAGWVILGLAAVIFIKTVGLPVPVKTPPLPFEETIASISFDIALRGSGDIKAPIEPTDANLIEGAKVYKTNCAFCHSVPSDKEASAAAKGMFPGPPMLFQADQGMTNAPVGTIYWLIKNGIRLTGMPGFEDTLSDEKLWQVSWLVKRAADLPPSVTAELEKASPR